MQLLVYQCPNCGEHVEVTDDMLDQTVRCSNPRCGQPFAVARQVGRFVGTREAPESESLEEEVHRAAADEEKTLRTVHPAMARRHPFQFLGCLLLIVAGAAAGIAFALAENWPLALVGGAVALAGLAWLGYWYLRIVYTTLTITTRRSILQRGIVARRTSEVRHNDVRNLQIDQTLVERLLGVGDLAISSAGQADVEIQVRGIRGPEEIAQMIRDLQTE